MATRTSDPFASALQTLRSAHQERRARRLTPTMPPPRDSDPTLGDPLPEHGADRAASLPPPRSAWATSDADEDASDDGGPGR